MNNRYPEHTVIHPKAQIGENVTIGPFSFIDADVVVGDNTYIGPHVTILNGARIGASVQVHSGAVISGLPQDLKYKGEETTTVIGDRTVIREYVTINRGTSYAMHTKVGSDCLLMAYSHVAHDCILGDRVILANNVTLAGHVEIEDWAILEGLVAVQQFTRIGQHAFVAGGSLVRKSVPPYVRAAREPISYIGVNNVGLTRRGFSRETINQIHEIYRILFVRGKALTSAVEDVKSTVTTSEELETILTFIASAEKTGIIRGFTGATNGSD
ncbi:MAG: acyl-ACP--UDP-N-acetylglucosamine O-acyltransferase [Bacteroidota bacterium]